ncbi:restriction endonuclease subunit S [Paenibacillus illinoisensis]|uniref:restriction endonuclease subunit S n=1 Tax=Paenibacillus illinoisensis TaxID=59845 RepID=UPI003019E20B
MSFNIWKKQRLGEITTKIGSGSTPRGGSGVYKKEGIPFIRSQNVYNCEFNPAGLVYIDDEQAEKLSNVELEQDDVLLNITGDSVARCTTVPQEYVGGRVNQHIAIIRTHDNMLDSQFLKYTLVNTQMQKYLLSLARNGGTRAALTKAMIENLEISLPPLRNQKAIAKTLTFLDEKVEINNQINKKLEGMVQAIFKQWFVDFEFPNEVGMPYKSSGGTMVESKLGMIPEGWKLKNINDVTSVLSKGTTPTKKDIDSAVDESSVKFIKVKDIAHNGTILLNGIECIPRSVHLGKLKRSILKEWDILFSIAGTIGRVAYIDARLNDTNSNQAIAFIRLNDTKQMFYYIYWLLKSEEIQNEIKTKVVQAVQANVSLESLKNTNFVLPSIDILNKYNIVVSSIFNRLRSLQNENEKLINIRDSLLPKLMSGEIRVPIEQD